MTVYRWPGSGCPETLPLIERCDWNGLPSPDAKLAVFTPENAPCGFEGGASMSDEKALIFAKEVRARLDEMRSARPGCRFGVYNLPWRYRSWGTVATFDEAKLKRFQARNDLLAGTVQPDFFVPEIYTLEEGPANVRKGVEIQLREAKRVNGVKPIMPITMPYLRLTEIVRPLTWEEWEQIRFGLKAHASSFIMFKHGLIDPVGAL